MKKLGLHPEELRVVSFSVVADGEAERGTVRGNAELAAPIYTQGCDTWPGYGRTCQPGVYTCPECASPRETYDLCGPTDVTIAD
jgi:hypothetical protein